MLGGKYGTGLAFVSGARAALPPLAGPGLQAPACLRLPELLSVLIPGQSCHVLPSLRWGGAGGLPPLSRLCKQRSLFPPRPALL